MPASLLYVSASVWWCNAHIFMVNSMIAQFEEHDRRIFWMFVAALGVMLLLYVYFVSTAVVAVIARKEFERELGRTATQVASLESEYALLDKRIDLTLAHAQGFVDVSAPRYVTVESRENALTIREG